MSHIVIITSEMAGRINLSAELSRRLALAGHQVTIGSPLDLSDRVSQLGGSFVRLVIERAPLDGDVRPKDPRSFLRPVSSVKARRESALRALDTDGFIASLRDLQPDLVLIDTELSLHVIAASSAGFPVVLWTSMLSIWKRPGLPPLHSPIIPGTGRQGSTLGIEWAWLKFRAGKWLAGERRRIERLGTDRISVLRTLSKRLGFPFGAATSQFDWLVPVTFTSLPVLSFNAIELEFPHQPHPNCRYVGPVLSADRRPVPSSDPAVIGERLAALVARREGDTGRALLYCSFGAWHKGDDLGFVRRVVAAVEPHPEWDLIVGLGGRLTVEDVGKVPENVHVFAWAPQPQVLAHADVAIHHAGISTVNECIVAGVPMVVYPFDFLDQPGNSARVAYHGLGEVGERSAETSEAIERRIARVLGDESIRRRVEAMQKAFERYEREDRPVASITEFLTEGEG